ncbi:MAG TPA: aminoglycoside phosphotransferase family protein [Nocardioidaceae bacterium]|nr:aminoglycoside phosphotransferase family protein [Nocardioidaceae bacterium]
MVPTGSTGGLIPFDIPAGLLAFRDRDETWLPWLSALPRLVRDVVEDWELAYDGAPLHGFCALVVPVRTTSGRAAMLKLSWPHDEEEHEHVGLELLRGNGMVRMYRADPRRHALLLERLHAGEDLRSLPIDEACHVVAGLYRRIHVPAPPQLRPLTDYITRWTAGLEALPNDAPIPRRLVEQSIALGKEFVSDPAATGTMIHGDLHYENVLAGDREPWLVIDPKPMSGDPHYELAPMLWNRWDEVVASGNVREAVRRRFLLLVDTAELDEDRARGWVVVREIHNALWAIEDAERAGRPLDDEDREWITRCVTIAKAVQD